MYGLARRQSGDIDIYWNFTLIESTKDIKSHDIDLTFDSIYIILKKKIGSIETF